MSKRPTALTIAGSDSSGGAGVQADLKTFSALGVYGASVLTAITAQNTIGVQGIEKLPSSFVAMQLESVLDDLEVDAIKTGMLGTAEIIHTVAARLNALDIPSVVDPVMIATSGDRLLDRDAIAVVKSELIGAATIVTPNIEEAAALLEQPSATTVGELISQGEGLRRLGCRAVLMKGGHLDSGNASDVLVTEDGALVIEGKRIATRNTHGTGCTLASAIAAHLAAGFPLEPAVRAAKQYLTAALAEADRLNVGAGNGAVDHLFAITPPHLRD